MCIGGGGIPSMQLQCFLLQEYVATGAIIGKQF